jgi:hypothetical protein
VSARRTRGTNSRSRLDKKKDMGIPNSFPFKDQVLAEQAEEKRLVC